MPNISINKLNIAKVFFLLFLISLFFPIRYIFPTKDAFQTGAYSDFTSVSLYLSDIFLFLTILFIFLPRGGRPSPRGEDTRSRGKGVIKLLSTFNFQLVTLFFWLILGLILHFKSLSELNWWFFGKYIELIVAYGTTLYLFNKTDIKQLFIKTFVLLSSLESILALWQFIFQQSTGLFGKLGEQVLSPQIQGVAKIVSSGTAMIRGYGTFPHPNLLSAFLSTAVLLSLYLFIESTNKKAKLSYSMALFINLIGLTTTFSRAGFLALGIGLTAFFGYLLLAELQKNKQPSILNFTLIRGRMNVKIQALLITLVTILLCFIIFRPYLLTRATVTDDAALERIFYAKIGLQMIKHQPVLGIGIGDSVLHMQQYSPIKLWPWQIQPIHNYFLLSAAELGIPGMLILIWIFLQHLWELIKKLKTKSDLSTKGESAFGGQLATFNLLLVTIFCSFLVLMQFDHYFYTLQQTQMLLWVILGIIAAAIKSPSNKEEPNKTNFKILNFKS